MQAIKAISRRVIMSNSQQVRRLILICVVCLVGSACTTINVDQVRLKDTLTWNNGDAMVVLGRHQTPEIQTEASLVSCIAVC